MDGPHPVGQPIGRNIFLDRWFLICSLWPRRHGERLVTNHRPIMITAESERRYDGPVPPSDPAAGSLRPDARALLYQRLAAEQRADLAARRRRAPEDQALPAGSARLRFYRDRAIDWRSGLRTGIDTDHGLRGPRHL